MNLIDSITAMPRPKLTHDEINVLIAKAQRGDNNATMSVLREHMGVLMREVAHSVRLVTNNGFAANSADIVDDITSDAIQVFFRVLESFDPERAGRSHFGGLLKAALRRDENMNSAINRTRALRVPVAVAARRAAAIKEAGGDLELARTLARKHRITPETFDAVNRVYATGVELDREWESSKEAPTGAAVADYSMAVAVDERGYIRMDTLIDTARALDALDFTSRIIVESAFGLNGQPQQSNAEIGETLGMSRWSVQRRIDSAMLVMRNILDNESTNKE